MSAYAATSAETHVTRGKVRVESLARRKGRRADLRPKGCSKEATCNGLDPMAALMVGKDDGEASICSKQENESWAELFERGTACGLADQTCQRLFLRFRRGSGALKSRQSSGPTKARGRRVGLKKQ